MPLRSVLTNSFKVVTCTLLVRVRTIVRKKRINLVRRIDIIINGPLMIVRMICPM